MINIKLTMTDKAMDTVTKQVIILVYAMQYKAKNCFDVYKKRCFLVNTMELFSPLKQNSENNTYQLKLIPWHYLCIAKESKF